MFNIQDLKKRFHRHRGQEQENPQTTEQQDQSPVDDEQQFVDAEKDSNDTSDKNLPQTLGDFAEQQDSSLMSVGDDGSSLDDLQTVKKKRILAIVACVAAFGVGAMFTTSLFSGDDVKKPTDSTTQGSLRPHTSGNGNTVADANGLPTDYASISKVQANKKQNQMNQMKKAQKGQTGQNGYDTSEPGVSSSDVDNLAPRPLPPIQSSSNSSSGYSGSGSSSSSGSYSGSGYDGGSVSREESEADKARAAREKADQKAYVSAIAFTSGVSRSASSSDNSGSSTQVTLKPGANGGTAFFGSDPAGGGSEYTLQSGSVIQATLLTGINSDMGNTSVIAQVSQNVYDTDTGTHLLIPQGSRLVGKVGSVGGNRIGVTFERLIFPDGSDVDLPNIGVIDGTGIPGMKDQYNSHDATFFRGALISGLLGALADSVDDDSGSSTSNSGWGSTTTYNDSLSNVVDNITDRLMSRVEKQSDRAATITIRPGFQFSVFINADIDIPEFTGYSYDFSAYNGFLT